MKRNCDMPDKSQRHVMAIVNVTDDSFYSTSRTYDSSSVAKRVEQALREGATILDIGGYSSRPGAVDISVEEEWRRVRMGLSVVRNLTFDIPISIDTFRSEVVLRAVEEFGPVIINDITAGEADDNILEVASKYNLPYVAMHMRGTPQTMQQITNYPEGVVNEVYKYFAKRCAELRERGVKDIVLDVGFGFAKSLEQNYELLAGLKRMEDFDYPLLVGLSRKSMIYKALGGGPADALAGTAALHWEALRGGATILRVHDVKEAADVIRLFSIYEKCII